MSQLLRDYQVDSTQLETHPNATFLVTLNTAPILSMPQFCPFAALEWNLYLSRRVLPNSFE